MKVTIRRGVLRDTISWLHEHHEQFEWQAWLSVPGMTYGDGLQDVEHIMHCGSQCCIAGYMSLQYAKTIYGQVDVGGDVYKDGHMVNSTDMCAVGLITGLDPATDKYTDTSKIPSELSDLFGYFLFFPWANIGQFYDPWQFAYSSISKNVIEATKRLEWLLDGKDPFLYNSDEETRDNFLNIYGHTFEFEYID